MPEITDPLNAFREHPGPVLLLAGPGTGKTYQLAKRVEFLVAELDAKPDEIAVITFTGAAARGMRARLGEDDIELEPDRYPEIISTMHSLGNTILGTAPSVVGLPDDYRVLHERAQRRVLLEDAATLEGLPRDAWRLVDECRRKGHCEEDDESDACRICRQYQAILRKCGRVDYDDQILLACKILESDADQLAAWTARCRYLLVDEYQDINEAQWKMIKLLSSRHTDGLFAVGDDDQSIYSFRGGDPAYIKSFDSDYSPDVKLGRLSKSWRCPEHILLGSRAVVEKFYEDGVPKPTPTFHEGIETNNEIVFYDVPSQEREAALVAQLVLKKQAKNSVILLVPNKKYFGPIKQQLVLRGISYSYRSQPDEKGVTRLANLADWVDDKSDSILLRYILDLVVRNHNSIVSSIDSAGKGLRKKRQAASEMLASLWKEVDDSRPLHDVVESKDSEPFIERVRTECLAELGAILSDDGGSRKGLPRFLQLAAHMSAPGRNPDGLVGEIRDWRSEKSARQVDASCLPLSVYNMPSSKGLEADIVIAIGLSDGLFPDPDGDSVEQGRLMFVVMTRARRELHLFSARTRSGSVTLKKGSFQLKPSSFIKAIPDEHLTTHYIKA